MENKKSFLAYADWKGMFDALPDEIAGKLVKHLFAYVNDLNPQSDDFIITALFEPIKATLKRDLIKWEMKSSEKSHNGRMGNLKRYNSDIYEQVKSEKITLEQGEELAKYRKDSQGDNSPSLPLAKLAVSDSVSDSVSVSDKKEGYISFDDFWNLYDKKVSKDKSIQKWNKLSEKDKELIIQFIPKYKEYQPDRKFRKDPLTFFNNKTWMDELTSEKPDIIPGETQEERTRRLYVERMRTNPMKMTY